MNGEDKPSVKKSCCLFTKTLLYLLVLRELCNNLQVAAFMLVKYCSDNVDADGYPHF